jgi:Lon protease-like protein
MSQRYFAGVFAGGTDSMLADDCAPSHAASLVEALRYARTYAEGLHAMLAEGKPDADKAARLVQALRNMLCTAEDELDALDDTQAQIDAAAAIHGLSDAALFSAITEHPTSETP